MNKRIIILFFTFCFSLLSFSQSDSSLSIIEDTIQSQISDSLSNFLMEGEEPMIPDAKEFHADSGFKRKDYDPIYAVLDSLAIQKYLEASVFTDDVNELNIYNYSTDSIPIFSDSVMRERFEILNLYSPIEMVYNEQVKSYIETYAKRKKLTSKMLGLSEIYFPIFEELLDKYDVPLEMKYLAIVESALNPKATSRAGARGLWQFMYNTGKIYGLQTTSITDDRCDPYKATDAACRHLKDLYNIYNDWSLSLAAYNCGAGNVNRAIQRSGGKRNYWLLMPYLPRETRGYVPAFMAVSYIMNYATEHNIYPITPGIFNFQIDTVTICDLLSFDQISEVIGAPIDMIDFLNPMYKKGIIPASAENPMSLTLPYEYIRLFIANEDSIYTYKTKAGIEREHLLSEMKKIENQTIHAVKRGETLSLIAQKYRCSVSQLKSWNKLKSSNLQIGQRLVVFPVGGGSVVSKESTSTASSAKTTEFHTVKKGESLGKIAERYHCSISELQKWNNLKSTNIAAGQKLRVKKAPTTKNQDNSTQSYSTYTVKQGDNLWKIANKYDNVSIDEIKSMNKLKSTNLSIGQKIKIPKKS